jgi:hypothetical protein
MKWSLRMNRTPYADAWDSETHMRADRAIVRAPTSTPLSRQFMCWWTTSCPSAKGPGAPARISDAELITLVIARVFLGLPDDRRFLALACYRLGFP